MVLLLTYRKVRFGRVQNDRAARRAARREAKRVKKAVCAKILGLVQGEGERERGEMLPGYDEGETARLVEKA